MTPERAKELLPIIQAFAEGKDIELLRDDRTRSWQVSKNLDFSCSPDNYRIKQAPAPPIYRPFNDNEMLDLLGKCIKRKNQYHSSMTGTVVAIQISQLEISQKYGLVVAYGHPAGSDVRILTRDDLLNSWTFLSGHPCGVRET